MLMIKDRRIRKALGAIIPFVLIPAVAFAGAMLLDARWHLWVSLAVALLTLWLFIAGVEKKMVGSRRAVLVAVMIALCVVGRLIPFFKPVTAITVLAAVYLGKESGFTVGAFAALLSNFYAGQGPWTPFQMLAWGSIGFFAGLLSKPLQRSRAALLLYGGVSGVVFSLIMDLWSVMWYEPTPTPALYWGAIVTALPHTVLYLVSNLLILYLLAKPFGDKLNRIKIKYGV